MDSFKRLYRSRSERKIAGLCGGLGEYFGVDPVAIRLLWVVLTFFTGVVPGVLAYIVAWLVVPEAHASRSAAPAVDRPEGSAV